MVDEKECKKEGVNVRHTTRKNSVEPTHSVPIKALGKLDKDVLSYLYSNSKKRFNVREFSRINKIARTNIYDSLDRLQNSGFVLRTPNDNRITEKGIILVQSFNIGNVGACRSECRNNENLSAHLHKFKLQIESKKKFRVERLNNIKNNGFKINKLQNWEQTIVNFDDATVIINEKQVIVQLFEVQTENIEDSDLRSLDRAINYAELLRKIGIETEGIMIESGEWARYNSILSNLLYEKVDNRYFLDLGDGKKFWIDHSLDKNEDETNNKIVREKVDNLLKDVVNTDARFSDINKINESLGFITKLEATRLMKEIEETKTLRTQLELKKKDLSLSTQVNFECRGNYIG